MCQVSKCSRGLCHSSRETTSELCLKAEEVHFVFFQWEQLIPAETCFWSLGAPVVGMGGGSHCRKWSLPGYRVGRLRRREGRAYGIALLCPTGEPWVTLLWTTETRMLFLATVHPMEVKCCLAAWRARLPPGAPPTESTCLHFIFP